MDNNLTILFHKIRQSTSHYALMRKTLLSLLTVLPNRSDREIMWDAIHAIDFDVLGIDVALRDYEKVRGDDG